LFLFLKTSPERDFSAKKSDQRQTDSIGLGIFLFVYFSEHVISPASRSGVSTGSLSFPPELPFWRLPTLLPPICVLIPPFPINVTFPLRQFSPSYLPFARDHASLVVVISVIPPTPVQPTIIILKIALTLAAISLKAQNL